MPSGSREQTRPFPGTNETSPYFMQGVVFAAVMADAAMVERAIALDVAVG